MRTIRSTQRALAILVTAAAAGLAGCEGENLFRTGEAEIDLNAIRTFDAVQFVIEDQRGNVLDVLEPGNAFELTLDENAGEFESAFSYDGVLFNRTGRFDIDGERIVFDDDPFRDDGIIGEAGFDFDDTGTEVFLEHPEAIWDVDGDGLLEVVNLQVRLERR